MIRRPPRSTQSRSSAASDVYKRQHDLAPTKANLITGGPHARRSRLLFEKALGKGVTVGVMPIAANDYDEQHWWHSSQGVRVTIGEMLAYGYARLLFYPPQE